MILFLLYATATAALLGLAADRLESALRGRGLPARWVWLASLGASVGVGAWALLRPPAPAAAPAGWSAAPKVLLTELGHATLPPSSLLGRADDLVVALWVAGSALLAVGLWGGMVRLAWRARRWAPARVSEAHVLLSEDFGPAVLGLRRPRVVLPRWALGMQPERLRLVVLHEEEHRRAGDAALLMAGSVALVAAPWNPALWWQFHRLRGAVELDCDARVLKRGAPAAMYGRLLLELGTHDPGLPLPLAALSRPPSLLERRLTMIVRGGVRGSVRRSLGALAVAGGLVALACEAPIPTAVRPTEAVDASEPALAVPATDVQIQGALTRVTEGSDPVFYVNGKRAEGKPSIPVEDIERVEVVKGGASVAAYGAETAGRGVVHIVTKDAPAGFRDQMLRPAPGEDERIVSVSAPPPAGGTLQVRPMEGARIYVDGVLFEGALSEIDPATIDKIEVVKGADAASSTVRITLKR